MKKINVVLLLLILCTSLVAAPLSLLAQEDEVVATVNGVVITKTQFYDLLERNFGSYALQELVQDELVRQKAEALQVSIDDQEFNEVYARILSQLGGPEGLQMFLMQNKVTEAQFIEQLRWNVLMGKLAATEVEVNEADVAAWFEENRQYYDKPETVEVSHILVDTEEEAQEILGLLQSGSDLANLAAERSLDPGTASQGGYLGAVAKGYTVPEFEEMAFALAVGEYGVAESNYGWHIITVHAKNEAEEAVFSEIADRVEKDYRSNKALDIQSYMLKLEGEADLQILWQPR